MKIPTLEELEAQVAAWNAEHPVGTPVMRYKLINPRRHGLPTQTTSAAWVMSGHSAMVMVEGVSGGVLLESVRAIRDDRRHEILADFNSLTTGVLIALHEAATKSGLFSKTPA